MNARKAFRPVVSPASAGLEPDSADQRRVARSFAASLILWSIAFLLAAFVPLGTPPEKRAVYREVAISLATPRLTAPAGATANAGDGKPAATAKQGTGSSAPAKAGEAAKAASAGKAGTSSPKKAAATQTGLGIPDFAPSSRNQASAGGVNDSLEFGSVDGVPAAFGETETRAGSARAVVPEIEGSVASVKKGSDGPVSATARTTRGGESEGVSSDTARELGGIATSRASASGTAPGGQATGVSGGKTAGNGSAGSGSGDGTGSAVGTGTGSVSSVSGFAFEGRPRGRLYPATVSIVLPENLSRLVDSNRSVTVGLIVLADGTVPAGLVAFSPQAALPAEIRDYLTREFSRWRFEKSDQDGQARFSYSIRVQ
jgi:hypothetical protein